MAHGGPAVFFCDLVAEFDDFGCGEVDDLACFDADELVVWGAAIRESVVCLFAVVEYLFDDSCADEEFDGPVNGCFGDDHAEPAECE